MKEKSAKDYRSLNKEKIRSEFLRLRNSLSKDFILESSAEIFAKAQSLENYKSAKTVMFYLSCGSEVFTDDMIKAALKSGRRVAVPAITNLEKSEMEAVEISKIQDADKIILGIRQPDIKNAVKISKDEIDFIAAPGLVFDIMGFRIGYGKGFFDRWLREVDKNKTVGLAYDFQIIDKICRDENDKCVGNVISEKRILAVPKKEF
ncbi:MAG: 5-formyltetrahydrofolate cyclo-ligase [Elusimicrobiota bacterium]|jgi:5-formyltetrahydrofolate cyclo-ligase|nr:5-formyltetrahydrofolate cyclo-ligase [Elusimicrobiota bacterium]